MEDSPQQAASHDALLEQEIVLLREELVEARRELGVARGEVLNLRDQLVSEKQRSEFLFRDARRIAGSRAYKLGRLLTLPLRAVRRLLRRR